MIKINIICASTGYCRNDIKKQLDKQLGYYFPSEYTNDSTKNGKSYFIYTENFEEMIANKTFFTENFVGSSKYGMSIDEILNAVKENKNIAFISGLYGIKDFISGLKKFKLKELKDLEFDAVYLETKSIEAAVNTIKEYSGQDYKSALSRITEISYAEAVKYYNSLNDEQKTNIVFNSNLSEIEQKDRGYDIYTAENIDKVLDEISKLSDKKIKRLQTQNQNTEEIVESIKNTLNPTKKINIENKLEIETNMMKNVS